MPPLFIGVGYKKQSGKDTFANFLADALDCDTVERVMVVHFADPLKQLAMNCFGLTKQQCFGSEEAKNSLTEVRLSDLGFVRDDGSHLVTDPHPLTARQVLQLLGTDKLRKAVPGIWAKAPIRRKYPEKIMYVVIPDVRFPDEAEAIAEAGGVLIRVDRPGLKSTDKHASETSMDGYTAWDHVITNDGTFQDLNDAALLLADKIK